MNTIDVDDNTYHLPATISDVQQLITMARQKNNQIRVRGSNHSVPRSIYPDSDTSKRKDSIFVMLSKMNGVTINKSARTVIVEAGCHLGYDPIDPTGISTWENSLFAQLDNAGYAIPDMGGIIHQTVGGFLSTGSSGGSTKYSFSESLLSVTFFPADKDDPQPLTASRDDNENDLFYAVGVSMGLLGIIVSATFSLVEKFAIEGTESITSIDDCIIDMNGKAVPSKKSLKEFLTTKDYARILWYPQPDVSRVTVWEASKIALPAPFDPKPYQEFQPIFGIPMLPQVIADLVYSAIGQWPKWLGDLIGTNNDFYQIITDFVSKNFYTVLFPKLLPFFVTEDKDNKDHPGAPQTFKDYWYSSLPMDNNVSDKLFPVEFTELWIPFSESDTIDTIAEVLKSLNDLFTSMYAGGKGPLPGGAFCIELYAAKKSDFWMSPSYGSDVFRVDVFWFKANLGSPADNYYPLFWEALEKFNFRCHWGKYMPHPTSDQGVDYLKKQYPKWNEFMALRQKLDPLQIFINDYWRKQLGVEKTNEPVIHKEAKGVIPHDDNGLYHPKNEQEIIDLVQYAIKNKLKLRVRGAAQSVSESIYTDSFKSIYFSDRSSDINILLDQMRKVEIDNHSNSVTVQAGCNLGYDPYDPSGESSYDNGLFNQLKDHGLAIPNVSDAIHQTVGGFISTASSGGSLSHSFLDAILSIRLIDGTGKCQVYDRPYPEDENNSFYAVGVSMGLMGVIVAVTFKCIPNFNVIGEQTITADDNAPVNLFETTVSAVIPNLGDFLSSTEFCRLIWWPFPTVKRIIIWQAHMMQPSDYNDATGTSLNFKPKPYEDFFYPKFLPKDIKGNLREIIEIFTELTISSIFSVIGHWPRAVKDLGNEITVFGEKIKATDIQSKAEKIWPKIFPHLLDIFMPCDEGNPPQKFWDNWVDGLSMDTNEYNNNLLPSYRTEFWVPVSQSEQVMTMLESYYKNQFFPNSDALNRNDANSCFVIEILGGKGSNFWLSPSYHQDSIRINLYSLRQTDDEVITYFQQFWDLFFINKINFRLHWGYHLPKPFSPEGVPYIKQQFSKWNDFMSMRKEMDPHDIFVNTYWRTHLNIS